MTNAPHQANPPAWAEDLLRSMLPRHHRDSVSGDLLEEYRDRILPARGATAADAWYIRQTLGFVWRATWMWGLLLAAGGLIRGAFDQFDPPQSFYVRSVITTQFAVLCFVFTGFTSGRRADSIVAAAVSGLAAGLIAAALEIIGSGAMLAVWHDPRTLEAIARSGGLGEAFTLPFVIIVPGTILATLGGAAGKLSAATRRVDVI